MTTHMTHRSLMTACGLNEMFGKDKLTADVETVDCPDCRWAIIWSGRCPECGGTTLAWSTHPRKLAVGISDGRLTIRDVDTIFALGCPDCSATLISPVDPEVVAAELTRLGWMPRRG